MPGPLSALKRFCHRRSATPDSCRRTPTALHRHRLHVPHRLNLSTRCAATKSTHDKLLARGATAPLGGNLKTRLDARGKLASYAYDALNRLVQASA